MMATKWTKEQLDAINLDGNNIIVSAGAGSGKTAVLSERVLRKVNHGVHINEILILTFTNAAAKEMKDRIRNKLKESGNMEEVNLIDTSYITTFDSFSLSVVKKYHTILNISKDIGITDSSLLCIKKNEILDEIFDEYYESSDSYFKKLINDYCFKDDKELKRLIIKVSDKLDMKYDKLDFLNSYLDKYYSSKYINDSIDMYYNEIEKLIYKIKSTIKELSLYLDGTYISKLEDNLSKLYKSTNYDDVVTSLDFRLSPLPKNSLEDAKLIKEKISSYVKEIKSLAVYESSNQIREEILSTKSNVEKIIEIITEFDRRFNKFKLENNMFDFSDINKMAIDIVSNHKDIRNELKNMFKEIMIDEYQDTNDIGEYFISLISNNNVYMVGDIKQSIYRFRNANPYIFKGKYDLYSNTSKGIKIDLLKNFRSREEVLSDINLLFNDLMTDDIGGADYKKSHQMIFGNKTYNEDGHTNQNYNLELLTYKNDKTFSNAEKEIFIIGEDIIKKVSSKYQIFDKDECILRNVKYSDFVILIDRATDFDTYKKVFEYLGIPLTLYKDVELKNGDDILVIRNLLKLIKYMDLEDYNKEFKYAFLSIGRSFLFRLSDDELFNYITKDIFKQSIIYKKLEEAYNYYYELSPKMFLIKLLEIFNYEEKLLNVGGINVGRVRLEYFYNLLNDYSKSGNDINDFIDYLDNIFELDNKVTFPLNSESSDSVKIMTIHKSKGLEFPICYFSGFTKEFSFRELNDNILYSNKYGIITPYFNEYIKPTIYKTLLMLDTKNEELSEKIRLFYVAVTRAKEQMIIVMPELEEEISIDKEKIKSFYDMIKLIYSDISKYVVPREANYTKDYLINKNSNDHLKLITNDDNINIENYNFIEDEEVDLKFSKNNGSRLITKEEKEKMVYGTKVHEVLELMDFKNPNYTNIDSKITEKIKSFIDSDLIKNNINSKFYKEYEFIYKEENIVKNGIIDLMIENESEIIIIDYKLKNIDDDAYNEQLNGYGKYIASKTNKKISKYLYSIIDCKFKKIEG